MLDNVWQLLAVTQATFPSVPLHAFDRGQFGAACSKADLSDIEDLRCENTRLSLSLEDHHAWNIGTDAVLENASQVLRKAQDIMKGAATNYELDKMYAGVALAALATICAAISCYPALANLSLASLTLLSTFLLHGILMFASSYVEEEQQFWYWTTSAWLFTQHHLRQYVPSANHLLISLTLTAAVTDAAQCQIPESLIVFITIFPREHATQPNRPLPLPHHTPLESKWSKVYRQSRHSNHLLPGTPMGIMDACHYRLHVHMLPSPLLPKSLHCHSSHLLGIPTNSNLSHKFHLQDLLHLRGCTRTVRRHPIPPIPRLDNRADHRSNNARPLDLHRHRFNVTQPPSHSQSSPNPIPDPRPLPPRPPHPLPAHPIPRDQHPLIPHLRDPTPHPPIPTATATATEPAVHPYPHNLNAANDHPPRPILLLRPWPIKLNLQHRPLQRLQRHLLLQRRRRRPPYFCLQLGRPHLLGQRCESAPPPQTPRQRDPRQKHT